MSRLCSVCNQDHSKPLQKWCDRSDLEIQNEKLQAENSELKKDRSKLVRAIERIREDVSNGEHIDSEWVELALRDEAVSPAVEASVKMYEAIKKENSELRRKLDLAVDYLLRIQAKRYGCCNADEVSVRVATI